MLDGTSATAGGHPMLLSTSSLYRTGVAGPLAGHANDRFEWSSLNRDHNQPAPRAMRIASIRFRAHVLVITLER